MPAVSAMAAAAAVATAAARTTITAAAPARQLWATAPANTTISGISSGADFAVQMHVAFSADLHGVGVFAGQPYHCAVTRFPRDVLANKTNPSVPVCRDCPEGTSLIYDHCKNHPQWVDTNILADAALQLAAEGKIDNTSNLHDDRVYLYRGTKDPCYVAGSLAQTLLFYGQFVERIEGNIAFEDTIPSLHALPTNNGFGSACGTNDHPNDSYIEACNYSGAAGVLSHLYGPLNPPSKAAAGSLRTVNQSLFFGPRGSGGMADSALLYVPPQCEKRAEPPRCRLHVFHHGCGGPGEHGFWINAARNGGFNEIADTNDFVVLYPAMSSWGSTVQTKAGCWDAYAQTGADYATKDAVQMSNVKRMIDAVVSGDVF